MWPDPNPVFVKAKVGDYLFHGIPMFCNQDLTFENLDVILMCTAYSKVHPPSVLIDDPVEGMNSFSLLKYVSMIKIYLIFIFKGEHYV